MKAAPKAAAPITEDTLHATDGTNAAALVDDRWQSENTTFALWLNTAFLREGRTDADLCADLEAHGLACEYGASVEPVI